MQLGALAIHLLANSFLWGKKEDENDAKKKDPKFRSRTAAPSNFVDPSQKKENEGVFSSYVSEALLSDGKNENKTEQSDKAREPSPVYAAQTDAPKEMLKVAKKLVMLGDGGTGKTSLVRRYVYSEFDEKYLHTIGVHITKKEFSFPSDGISLTMNIWDLQGQKNIMNYESNLTGAMGAFIVCDVTRTATLEHIPEWINMLEKKAPGAKMVLLANKWDLKEKMEFGEHQMRFLAGKHECRWFPTSAKTGENVEAAFHDIATQMVEVNLNRSQATRTQ